MVLVYGLAKGDTERYMEQLLASRCVTSKDVDKVKKAASLDGWHSFRVHDQDDGPPDFVGTINSLRQRRKAVAPR